MNTIQRLSRFSGSLVSGALLLGISLGSGTKLDASVLGLADISLSQVIVASVDLLGSGS